MTHWEKLSLLTFILLASSFPYIIQVPRVSNAVIFIAEILIVLSASVFVVSGEKKE